MSSSPATGSPRWARPRPACRAATARARWSARQRLRAPPSLLGARPGHALPAGTARELPADPAAGLVAAGPRAGRAEHPAVGAGGGLDALLAGDHDRIDHHASPNSIDGSLDVIAAALEELGLRSVLCYEVTDRDGLPTGRRGNRREPAGSWHGPRRLARGMMGAHASFTLVRRRRWPRARSGAAAGLAAGIHIHVAEDAGRPAATRSPGTERGWCERLSAAGVLTAAALLAHCVHVGAPSRPTSAACGATVAHNPRSNMNNPVGYPPLARSGRPAGRARHRRHRRRHDHRVAGWASSAPAEAGLPHRPAWPLDRLAERAQAGRADLRRAAARHASRPVRPPT